MKSKKDRIIEKLFGAKVLRECDKELLYARLLERETKEKEAYMEKLDKKGQSVLDFDSLSSSNLL